MFACVFMSVSVSVCVCYRYKILAAVVIGLLVMLQIVLTVYLESDINGDYLRFVRLPRSQPKRFLAHKNDLQHYAQIGD